MGAAKKLIGFVTVDGLVYGPDSEIPDDVAKRIGDHAWAAGEKSDADSGDGDTEVDEANLAGSTVADLREYAASQGFDLGEATKKADVIAAIEAGIAARDDGDGDSAD